MKKNYYQLSINEMLSVVAGDNLPEVVVASSYSRVYGMNYNTWYWANFGFLQNSQTGPRSTEVFDGESGSLGGGGGSSAGLSIDQSLKDDLFNLSTAFGLAAGSFEVTISSIELFLSDPVNKALFKRIGIGLGAIGVITGAISVVSTLESKNWDITALTWQEQVDLGILALGMVTVGAAIVGLGSLGGWIGFGIASGGLGWSIYRETPQGRGN